jgi:hypothetical protein
MSENRAALREVLHANPLKPKARYLGGRAPIGRNVG